MQNGVEHGVIHTSQYSGDVEEDLPAAVYEFSREDPIGAYAIDYITHDCTLIVAYYEIRIDITFRDVRTPLDEIEYRQHVALRLGLCARVVRGHKGVGGRDQPAAPAQGCQQQSKRSRHHPAFQSSPSLPL